MNCMNCGRELRGGLKFCPSCGTPAPQAAAYTPPPAQQMPTSWAPTPPAAPPRRKSRAGKILLIVFGVFMLLAGGAGVAIYYGVRHLGNTLKSSEPYRVAEKELRESVVANGVLGGIKSTGFPVGVYNSEPDGTGQATFTMSVEGTLARGQYIVTLERESGAWRVRNAVLRMPDGNVYDVLNERPDPASATPPVGLKPGIGPPPPPAPGVKSGTVEVPGAVAGGALDDKALSRPEPTYPSVARAAKATGEVVVRVTVDESGQVIMASAESGHPLLRAAAVAAARQARFAPFRKNGQSVKVVGTLTYKFG